MDKNDLTALPADVFDDLTALEWLDLSGNALPALPADVFDKLTALTVLYLTDNALTSLPADVFDQLTLTKLTGNDLTVCPATLTELYLSGNDLITLPADVFDQLTALTELYLSGNDLTTLPAGIFDQLTALTRLNLSGNDLTALPADVFENLTALFRNGLEFLQQSRHKHVYPGGECGRGCDGDNGRGGEPFGQLHRPLGQQCDLGVDPRSPDNSGSVIYAAPDRLGSLRGATTPSPSFTAPSTAGDLYFEPHGDRPRHTHHLHHRHGQSHRHRDLKPSGGPIDNRHGDPAGAGQWVLGRRRDDRDGTNL